MADVTKIDVAIEHVETAIMLVALGASVRSTHLQVMAANELTLNVAKKRGIAPLLDMDAMIRPERLKEWISIKNRAYNYFKHADRDADAAYTGPDDENLRELNDIMLMQAISHLGELGYKKPLFTHFASLVCVLYPSIAKWEEVFQANPQLRKRGEWLIGNVDRDQARLMLLVSLRQHRKLDMKELQLSLQLKYF